MSTLAFASGARFDAVGTRDAFGALSDALVAAGKPSIIVNYGDRDLAEEVRLFTSRYRQQATGGGPYGDVRLWNGSAYGYPGGTRWVRHSSAGTVAVPASSNHGRKRSGDLAYPYDSDTAAHRVAQHLARRFNITCEGMGFRNPREWWHWTYWGPLGAIGSPAGGGAVPVDQAKEWDEMATEAQVEAAVERVVSRLVRSASPVRVFEVQRGNGNVEAFIGAPGRKAVHIANPTERDILERYLAGGPGGRRDRFNSAELDILDRYMPLLDADG